VLVTGLIIIFWNLLRSVKKGPPSGPNPWGGTTLEWKTGSPPPDENFEEIPQVTRGPYYYREGGTTEA
jgi:cytochrome c oxidase subunit 1